MPAPRSAWASTKAFTGQLTALMLMPCIWAGTRQLSEEVRETSPAGVMRLPHKMETVLQGDETGSTKRSPGSSSGKPISCISDEDSFSDRTGRRLKLKEISYIHAEAIRPAMSMAPML